MKKWHEAIIHILFWLSSAWLIASSFSIQSHEIEINNGVEIVKIVRNNGFVLQLILCISFSSMAFYFNAWLIIKRSLAEFTQKTIWYVLITFMVLAFTIYTVTEIKLIKEYPPLPKQIAFGVTIFYFSISIAYGIVKNSIYSQQLHQRILVDKKQAELNLLRNQLQPHFLFNVLNNFLSMVNREGNPKLATSIDKLSQLLRFVIEDNKSEKVAVAKEIQFIKNYIDLQMLRFEDGEVEVKFNVNGKYDAQQIEPGLFIPFVENAFKYGTEPEIYSRIDIVFDLSKQDSLHFSIKNKIMIQHTNGIGTGIENTIKRLNLIYPDKHQLQISEHGDFIIHLSIQTQ